MNKLISISGPTAVGKTKFSIDLAKKILNWEPKVELKDGLIKTIDWFKNNL